MGSGLNSISTSISVSTSSPTAKRNRVPEDEVYLDNLHSHKRYLSEADNGVQLKWINRWRPLPENLMESPARDEMSMQYSPMSEDSDDSRFCEVPVNNCSFQSDNLSTSPVSPHRYQRPLLCFSPSHGCSVTGASCSQPHQRGSGF